MTAVTWTPPPAPAWVARVNALGDNLGGAESLIALDAASVVEAACAMAGLDDFGDDAWREPFAVLLDAIAAEAALTTVGRLLTRAEIVRVLANRLRVEATHRAHAAIAAAPVRAPIVVTGTARSGTSILFELLAQDPGLRAPATWEALYSVPPPDTATYAGDPRIASTDLEVTVWHEVAPAYRTMHANAGGAPNECIFLLNHAFASEHFSGVLEVPTYAAWLATHDRTPAFRYHRRMLQLLQWRCPGERWLLKAPSHLTVLPALLAVYPDAHIVHTHRDPVSTVASTVSLMATLRLMRRRALDVGALARTMARGIAFGLEKVMAERAAGQVPEAQVVDVRYHDLMTDPLGTLARLYTALGRTLSAETEARMRAYLAARPRGRHGRHRYALEEFGLDRSRLRARYAAYMARYDVPAD